MPAVGSYHSMTPVPAREPKHYAFNFLFGLLHRGEFREFAQKLGTTPNICVPKSLHDKYLWRKIFDHDPQFTVFCDKLAAKRNVASRCPDIPAARVLWQGNDIGQAPADLLEGPGFLKSNYGSGFYLKLDEQPRSLDELRAITTGWHRGWHHTKPRKWKYRGQWGYKNVERTLFIEADLSRGGAGPFLDFAVYVFGGRITDFSVSLDHKTNHSNYATFDASGRRSISKKATAKYSPLPDEFELPVSPTTICDLARRIAVGSDHLRIDLIWNGEDLHFSEITVYSQAGLALRFKEPLLSEMVESWDLRRSWFLTHPQTGWRRLYADWLRRALDAGDPSPPVE